MKFLQIYKKIIVIIMVCTLTLFYVVMTNYFISDINSKLDYISDHPYKVAYEISKIRARISEKNAYLPILLSQKRNNISDIEEALFYSQNENNKAMLRLEKIYSGNYDDIVFLKKALDGLDKAILNSLAVYKQNRTDTVKVMEIFDNEVEPQRKDVAIAVQNIIDSANGRVMYIKNETDVKSKNAVIYAAVMGLLIFILTGYSLWGEYIENIELKRQKNILLDALKSADKANAAKRNFLSRVSHEIRTPMNAIIGMTTIAVSSLDDKKIISDCLEKIGFASKHLLMLINDVLDMSKIEDGKMRVNSELFNFKEWLRALKEIIISETKPKEQSFEIIVSDFDEELLEGDSLRLSQILINILSNATKFTPQGGSVKLHIKKLRKEGDKIWVRFVIEDNGIGMSEDFLEHLYEPFEQADRSGGKGTGLGMAITKNMVILMGGMINVQSHLGEGTVFIVDLPFTVSRTSEAGDSVVNKNIVSYRVGSEEKAAAQSKGFDFTGFRVLVAEDNEINMEVLTIMLESVGFEATTAINGNEALIMYLEHEPYTYAAILMDVQMPVMDGYKATREIRGSGKNDASSIPIIALTANAFDEDVTESYLAGMNEHMSKPIDFKALFKLLDKILNKSK
ncbi:hybrid sensor histidine kinase/response regulator [Phascolarctobacterium faecium]|uniref:hybrid sensor histidine kinase/response regulator n=1 Tax=Phascolarctobacterium faecium TaxID=33025 RepID=UPI0026658935|nr:ATP-binding protein [Phascolarctobacterium faecium]